MCEYVNVIIINLFIIAIVSLKPEKFKMHEIKYNYDGRKYENLKSELSVIDG